MPHSHTTLARSAPFALLALTTLLGCAASRPPGTPPPRGAGCAIEIVREGVPQNATRRLGEVVARCRGAAADDENTCTRQLQDQACELGAVVIWDVRSRMIEDGFREMRAAAAVYR